ncbi:uncharacterized protein LOC128327734 isoform X2 [Hemicordylus capensis]|uniref:uncharacterized protein LOC128327734 isoform X2 n=1 Tax=Hemicordylus capensis TaxID=884348 RepID=UPI0023041578|nr:uncharacterized protein LOC128327734 isoform X2 [Hemicordylus capensis]
MDRYRYFIFNQKSMVVLGLLQITCATICTVSGLMDGAFRRESALSKSRIPIWAGVVNALIIASVFSCFTTLIVIVYASLTLEYGEKYKSFSDVPFHHPVLVFVLDKFIEGTNITILIASIVSVFIVLVIAYVSCRSLPCCSCYDSETGLEQLQFNDDQLQTAELVCISDGQTDTIFNSPVRLADLNEETDDEITKPPPYIRLI